MKKRGGDSISGLVDELEREYADYLSLRSRMPETDSRVRGVFFRFRDALKRYEHLSNASLEQTAQLVLSA